MAGLITPTFRAFDWIRPKAAFVDYFNDFIHYAAADWTITAVGTGTSALNDEAGGVLLLTNSAADDDGRQHQSVAESFTWVDGKKLGFEARFKISDAVEQDCFIGLVVKDTTVLASAPTDGIYFRKDDGDTLLDFVVGKTTPVNSTLTGVLGSTVLASNTWATVGFYYDGKASTQSRACIQAFLNGNRVGSLPLTNAPTTELALSFGSVNGQAVAKTMSIDYIRAFQER